MKQKVMSGFPPREKVLADLFAEWKPQPKEEFVALDDACGRILARTLYAKYDLPVYRASMCDGIAVRSADFANGIPDTSAWRPGEQYMRADTGDDFEDRYDAVIEIENVQEHPDGSVTIEPDYIVKPGCNVKPAGSTLQKGDRLVTAGLPLRPTDLAALAMGGMWEIPVLRRPRVAFIPTGSELVPPTVKPERGQNIDTNSVMAKHSLLQMGAEPILFPIVPDQPELLENALDRALSTADIVIINAGSAVGSEDYNNILLKKRGKLLHHYVAAAPGRPMAVALLEGKPTIDLPGPTMASYFGSDWCISAVVAHFLGQPILKRQTVQATLTEDILSPSTMAILCRIDLARTANGYTATPRSFHTESLPSCMATNGQYVSPVGEHQRKAGEQIEVELLRPLEYLPKGE